MSSGKNNEKLHPGHRSMRLRGYDYSSAGLYFLTICSHEKECMFGRVLDDRVELTVLGRLVRDCWVGIPEHFSLVSVHEFIVMPNHLHGIIQIGCQAGAQHAAPLRGITTQSRELLGAIVRSFKASVTRKARIELEWSREVWQRNYFERVIREGSEYADTVAYVKENPRKWQTDQENPDSR